MSCSLVPSRPVPARAQQAGFTLVELMVAMTGGLFLSIVVFALSRDATRFYQQESRAANATLTGVTGFERLSNDISRAGHLVTPNIDADPRVCNRPAAGWPPLVRTLRAVNIETTSSWLSTTEVGLAGIAPMAIELAGALDVTEELTTTQVGPNVSGGFDVFLRRDTPAAARLGIVDADAAAVANQAILQSIFMPNNVGRAVRIAQQDGMEQYGVVSAVPAGTALVVSLAAAPALMFRTSAAGAVQCGILGFNTGGSMNVVNFVRYELRQMTLDTAYAALFNASQSAGLPYESGRVELIRQELSPAGAVIALTREIVSEYAVDLQFSVTQAASAIDPTLIPVAAVNINAAFNSTQLLRGIHARLSVRSREADRIADVNGIGNPGDIYRVQLAGGGTSGGAPFARVRTFQSDIPLRNLQGANW